MFDISASAKVPTSLSQARTESPTSERLRAASIPQCWLGLLDSWGVGRSVVICYSLRSDRWEVLLSEPVVGSQDNITISNRQVPRTYLLSMHLFVTQTRLHVPS
jgi:hypothetical protein